MSASASAIDVSRAATRRSHQPVVIWCLAILVVAVILAGAFHPVELYWKASTTDNSRLVYRVYRATGECSNEKSVPKLIATTTELKYIDKSIKFGTFCYTVRTSVNGVESLDSNATEVSVRFTWIHH